MLHTVKSEILFTQGHSESITQLVPMNSGRFLVSVGLDQQIKIWNTPYKAFAISQLYADGDEKQLIEEMQGHSAGITSAATESKGISGRLATGSLDDTIIIWNVFGREKKISKIHAGQKGVSALAFGEKNQLLISGGKDSTIKLWSMPDLTHLKTYSGHDGSIQDVQVYPLGRYIFSASTDSKINCYDIVQEKIIRTFIGHTGAISAISCTSDVNYLVSGGNDKQLRQWDIISGKCIFTFPSHKKKIMDVKCDPDKPYIYSCSEDGTTKYWNLETGKCKLSLNPDLGIATAVSYISSSGGFMATGYSTGIIRLWRDTTGKNYKDLMDSIRVRMKFND